MTEQHAVDDLVNAKVGDLVWYYNSHANRYDDAGKYEGRGMWSLQPITAETRVSFEVGGIKFDRKTGEQRGTNGYAAYKIAGHVRKEATTYIGRHRYRIAQFIQHVNDADLLKQVAKLIGYNDAQPW